MVKHCIHTWFKRAGSILVAFICSFKLYLFQRQKLLNFSVKGNRINHSCVNDINFIKLLFPEKLYYLFADNSGSVNIRVLSSIFEIYINRNILFFKIFTTYLTDNKKHIFIIGKSLFLCNFDYIVVICTRHTFIGCDYDITLFSFLLRYIFSFIKIDITCIR